MHQDHRPEILPVASPHRHPKPDIYTWSVLLKVFMNHRQPRAAEKILNMMEARGVMPNQVTWNNLVIGYARMQDLTMTVDTIDRLQRAGFSLDNFTLQGLELIENRRALIEAMRSREKVNGKSLRKRMAWEGLAKGALYKMMWILEDEDGVKVDSLGGAERDEKGRDEKLVNWDGVEMKTESEFDVKDLELREYEQGDSDGYD